MLNPHEIDRLTAAYAAEHPQYLPEAWALLAQRLARDLDPALEPTLRRWLATGEEGDYAAGEFTLEKVRRLRRVSWLEALALLNEYLRDPEQGYWRIVPV